MLDLLVVSHFQYIPSYSTYEPPKPIELWLRKALLSSWPCLRLRSSSVLICSLIHLSKHTYESEVDCTRSDMLSFRLKVHWWLRAKAIGTYLVCQTKASFIDYWRDNHWNLCMQVYHTLLQKRYHIFLCIESLECVVFPTSLASSPLVLPSTIQPTRSAIRHSQHSQQCRNRVREQLSFEAAKGGLGVLRRNELQYWYITCIHAVTSVSPCRG